MVTLSRPTIPANEAISYCLMPNGELWYGTGTHPQMIAELKSHVGYERPDFDGAIFGAIWNHGDEDVPEYVNEQVSDTMPSDPSPEQQDALERKLQAVWPDIRTIHDRESYQDWFDTSHKDPWFYGAGWTIQPESAILSAEMSTSPIDAAIQQDAAASTAIQALTQAGGRVFVVGGAVRDAVLGKNPKDIDLMCQGLDGDTIEQTLNGLGRLDFTGKQFGVYRFKIGDDEVEIALPRTEISTGPGHQDFQVTTDPGLAPEADLARRDFTGNAMAYEPTTGQLLDPHGGSDDLANGTLSLVNDDAFRDDPLRIVRALVANARFGLEPDPKLEQAMEDNAQRIKHLPGERIKDELDKLFTGDNPAESMELAEKSGVLPYLAPELASTVGFDQKNPFHDLPVFDHTMMVLRAMSRLSNDPDLRLAALFHDSGKPDSFWQDESKGPDGGGHFYKKINDDGTVLGADHEEVGADRVETFMKRLRYSNDRIKRVTELVRHHMFPYFDSEKGARKFLRALNGDVKMAFDLMTIREADACGKRDGTMSDFDQNKLARSKEMLQRVLDDKEQGFTLKNLKVDGHDMMALGLKGKEIGITLNRLLDLIVDNPALNDKDTLLKIVEEAQENG